MKRIGVYTIIANNYGAQLQAYATAYYLQQICKGDTVELVYVPEIPNGHNWRRIVKSFLPQEIIRKRRFNHFQKLSPLTRSYTANEILNSPPQYDLHIVGSDQVWNVSEGMGNHLHYFLPFQTVSPKMALASSFGADSIPNSLKKQVHDYLADFSSIAVREADGVRILSEIDIQATQILDPTFWIKKEEWEVLAGNVPLIKGDYIVAVGFETNTQIPQKFMDSARKIFDWPIIGLIPYRHFHYDKSYNTFGPKEFLNVIKFSKLVLTSSFHSLVFSLMFQKDFYLLKHTKRNSRMKNLLLNTGLSHRMIDGDNDFSKVMNPKEHIDYTAVNNLIIAMQEKTREYISKTIFSLIS